MKKTQNIRRRAQPVLKIPPRQTPKCKNVEFSYNLRSKGNNVIPSNVLKEKNKQSPLAKGAQKILRRSKRISQKNNVQLKMYDCISDYYLEMQNEPTFKINQARSDDVFCEVLRNQLSHVRISTISTKCLQKIKNLVSDIDVHLEGSEESESEWDDCLQTRPNFFNTPKPFRFETLLKQEESEDELSPKTSFDFLRRLPEPRFTFDQDMFLPTMPELKIPSPLKFYPRLMHNL